MKKSIFTFILSLTMFLLSGSNNPHQELTAYMPIKNLAASGYVSIGFDQHPIEIQTLPSLFPGTLETMHFDIEEVENELISSKKFLNGNTFFSILPDELWYGKPTSPLVHSEINKRFLYIVPFCLPADGDVIRI